MMGGNSAKDRFDQKQFYPMLSLSIGCVVLPPSFCDSYHDVAVLASHAKSMAKKQKGNSLYIAETLTDKTKTQHNQHAIDIH